METILRYFASRHRLSYLITFSILMLGIYGFLKIKMEKDPKVDFAQMFITTIYPGASSADVELKVTNKIENELKSVSGIKYYTSVSMDNISAVRVFIDEDFKDQNRVKDEIRRAVDRVNDFPTAVAKRPVVDDLNSSIFPILEVGITGHIPYPQMREVAKKLKKKLENISGVSSLDPFGYLAREIKIEVSPEKVKKYHISLEEIYSAIKNQNIRSSGGQFKSYLQEKNVITLSEFKGPLEVGEVIVKSSFEGLIIKVKDLAIIKDSFKEDEVISRMNGKPAISFVVYKKENSDTVNTVNEIKELLKNEKQFWPKEIDFIFANDMSYIVKNRFNITLSNGISSLALCFLILTLFLNFRTSVWVSVGIPVSLLGAIAIFKYMGYTLDAISLSAMIISLGMIEDDAINISENIYRHFFELKKSPLDAAVDGTKEVLYPTFSMYATTVIAFMPMFLITGTMGKFIIVVPMVIVLALSISLFEALFCLPAHLVKDLESGKNVKDRKWFYKFKGDFKEFLKKVLIKRYLVLWATVAMMIASTLYFIYGTNFVLFPNYTTEKIFVKIEYPIGTSLEATAEKIKGLESVVGSIPKEEMPSFVARAGLLLGEHGERKPGKNFATIEVNLPPFGARKMTTEKFLENLRNKINSVGGFQAVHYELAQGGPPVGSPISIRVVGADDEIRKNLTSDLLNYLGTLKGVKDIDRDDKPGRKEVIIEMKNDAVSLSALNANQIGNTVHMAYDGLVATSSRFDDEDVDYRILLDESARGNENQVKELLVPNALGNLITLKNVANFKEGSGLNEIRHYKAERALTVTANVEKKITTPVIAIEQVQGHFNLNKDYPGMRFEIGGEAEETTNSMEDLKGTFILALIGIYFILALLFDSFLQPVYVLLTIPFSFAGALLAFALHREPFSFIAGLGFIGLAGIAVNNSIVLIDFINQFRKSHVDHDIAEMMETIAESTAVRLRSILLCSSTTVVGLLPLAYGIGGSDPFMVPMALSLAYGVLASMVLTLLVIPALYLIGEDYLLYRKNNIQFTRFRSPRLAFSMLKNLGLFRGFLKKGN